ncbi:alpha-glucosidase [Plesiomonas shigelloides]|uniref:alpha-glucosidase n=1 Tax=Plesiomonas shigelloides TaxID=703 RepID=UPI000D574982|nr:alpha-glucosidase [Plesiomonas shigelloides]PVU67917.1 alpha-glucosidase [Plesiomonas shigelloides]
MKIDFSSQTLNISHNGDILFSHQPGLPAFFLGKGMEKMEIYRGNFDIEDYVESRVALTHVRSAGDHVFTFAPCANTAALLQMTVVISADDEDVSLQFSLLEGDYNRFWMRLLAEKQEHIWGCGEQMSYFDLRGRHFPLWTSEPGVGRHPHSEIKWKADVMGKAGGDYYHTNYPQPTFVSSRKYSCHIDTTAYADFDFRQPTFHELQVWAIPAEVQLRTADSYLGIIEKLSAQFGRQPTLPEWVYKGAILGLKGGEVNTFTRLDNALKHDIKVSGLWSEDWCGLRVTSFGKRLFWDWDWQQHQERYPNLPERIKALSDQGIAFMAYVNPYLCEDGQLYPIAKELGYMALDKDGNVALVDFGEFYCGCIDFTNPDAMAWFRDTVLRKNMLDMGIKGWMADFGEYLPTDNIYLHNGVDAKLMHNAWPTLWAQCNAEALALNGQTGDALFFMRAGYTGVQKHCPLLWAGDQCVDFSRHDGLVTVISGALSSGMLGNAYHHSDIGGYTSLFGNRRTKELFDRWVEMAAFTPVMRTHEGNRPDENFQFDQDAGTLAHFARMTRVYCHLTPYLRTLSAEAAEKGYPVQRALMLHFEHDPETYSMQEQYLYGPDMLVAPVHQSGVTEWTTYLPAGEQWTHVWSGQTFTGGQRVTLPAPIGQPPVFYRAESQWKSLFAQLADLV